MCMTMMAKTTSILRLTLSNGWNAITRALADIGYTGDFTFAGSSMRYQRIASHCKYLHDISGH